MDYLTSYKIFSKIEDYTLESKIHTFKNEASISNYETIKHLCNSSFQSPYFYDAEEFKDLFWIDYQNGMPPIEIFKKYGFDPYALGAKRRSNFIQRLKKQAARTDGFKDTRSTNSGRPPVKELSLEEQLERLKHKNMVLQQENDFLKRVRFINKKQIVKQSKNKQ